MGRGLVIMMAAYGCCHDNLGGKLELPLKGVYSGNMICSDLFFRLLDYSRVIFMDHLLIKLPELGQHGLILFF